MNLSIIVAVAEKNVIGKDNALVWHLPADMKYFKETTLGHCVIMGRKNYESIPEKYRPLPNRINIIISRQKNYPAPGAIVLASIEEAVEMAKKTGEKECFIIGGAQIFKQSMHLVSKLYITKIYHSFDGDVFFPDFNTIEWKEISQIKGLVDEKNKFMHEFFLYEKNI